MRAQDLLRRKCHRIVQVRPGTNLMQVMRLMADEKVGTVLLIDDGEILQGIISERDFVRIFTEHGPKAIDFPVCDLVRRKVIVCHDDATLHDLITLMSNNGIRHLPVMRDGHVAGMISARDVLDAQKHVLMRLVKRHKQALNLAMTAKGRAEDSDHHKTEFLHRMSHELRTPLNAIIGFSEMIETEVLGPVGIAQYKDYSAEIGAAGHRLLRIISEILEMSRLEMGAWQSKQEIVDLEETARSGVAYFENDAGRKNIHLRFDAPQHPVHLVGDSYMITQMFRHLISNVIKFTPDGGDARIRIAEADDGAILVVVKDNGSGIPPDKVDWVTQPFCCAEDALTQSGEGAGLGLALTNAMIALHEGKLEIDSQLGEGTEVTLRFPAERRYMDDEADRRIA